MLNEHQKARVLEVVEEFFSNSTRSGSYIKSKDFLLVRPNQRAEYIDYFLKDEDGNIEVVICKSSKDSFLTSSGFIPESAVVAFGLFKDGRFDYFFLKDSDYTIITQDEQFLSSL